MRVFASLSGKARFCLAATLIGVLAGGYCFAQSTASGASGSPQSVPESNGQGGLTFGTTTNEVIVPVTVTDSKGRFVSDLVQSDFHIFDEGREQKIDFFSHEQSQPVVIGFLVDMSNRMKVQWDRYKESTSELMRSLMPGDKRYSGYLITYGTDAELAVDTDTDPEAMVQKLNRAKPAGGAALFDALYMACTNRKTVQGEPYQPRRVVIIIGDGHDSASKKSLREVLELALRNQITIYAMDTVAFGMHNDDEQNLVTLTSQTGGRVETPLGDKMYKDISGYLSNVQDAGNYAIQVGVGGYTAEIGKALFSSVADLMGEITTQYVLRYHPDFKTDCPAGQGVCEDTSKKEYRKIKVSVGLQNVIVRARDGYYPFPVPQSPRQ
ncbi:MAG TPA: VWA domain-containing protein [Bryobacteraceae bacterium]|jgi:VWFA-related protein|nr:VWA domain-containing protein [Bryobacteraceae bacterium]